MLAKQPALRGYIVWIPMLDRDEAVSVPSATATVANVNPQFFDGEKRVGSGLARAVGVDQPVWDAFLFYPPGARWTAGALPVPRDAVVQTNGVVIATPTTLPALADQSKLPSELTGKMIVAGAQSDIESLIATVAISAVAAAPPR